jgi:cysteine-rich repeat protein
MTDLGSSSGEWANRRRAVAGSALLYLALAAGGACGQHAGSPEGGSGGAITTTTTTTTAQHDAGTGGMGGMGGATTTTTTTTTSTTTTTATTTTSSTTTTGTGGAGGTGGADAGGVDGGTGGTGGSFQPPVGTADYPAEHEPNDIVVQANVLQPGTKGFTASIHPLGDIDIFEMDVTANGSSLAVATSDGMGGCPAGAQLYTRVFDAGGNVLAFSNGSSGCASFDAANTPTLFGLPVGKYYVHIENTALTWVPFYIVDLGVFAPFCGDGTVQVGIGEQCDHGAGNGSATDGCDATCQIESTPPYVDETEPNNTQATANSLDGYAGAVGEIKPAGDVDWYSVTVTTAGSSIGAEISDGFGNCPGGFDSKLSLYGPTGTLIVSDHGSGVAPCSRIAPQIYTQATNLPAGKYALSVSRITSSIQPWYVLRVGVSPQGCGDGVLPEGSKQCDPGPGVQNPGCSATCQLTGDFIPETEPDNNMPATANPLGTHAGFIASIQPAGDVDSFSFQVPGPSSLVTLRTSDGIGGCPKGFASVLTLIDPNGNPLATATNGGVGTCSLISPQNNPAAMNLAGGTYQALVNFKGNATAFWEYVVTISVAQPSCGDSIVETGEQCDDGPANGTAGDGCDAACQSIPPWEIRPNNSIATATPEWSGFSTWMGRITPAGDHGYFSFTLATAGTVTLTTHDVNQPAHCSSDTVLHLDDPSGHELAMNDDSGPGPGDPPGGQCSKISALPLAAGTYYAWVQRYGDGKVIPSYQLDLLVQ